MCRLMVFVLALMAASVCVADEVTVTRKSSHWTVVQKLNFSNKSAESHAYLENVKKSGGIRFPKDERTLIVYCADGALKILVKWNFWHLIRRVSRIMVTAQFDEEPAETKQWFVSGNKRYSFLQGKSVGNFIEKASKHRRLEVSTTIGKKRLTAEYTLTGFKAAEKRVRKYCVYDDETVGRWKDW